MYEYLPPEVTARTRALVDRANEEAHRLDYGLLGTEHLFLAAIGDDSPCVRQALGKLDLAKARDLVAKMYSSDDRGPGKEVLPLTPNAEQALLVIAPEVARETGDSTIEPAHVVVAVTRTGGSAFVHSLMQGLGLSPQLVADGILACIQSEGRDGLREEVLLVGHLDSDLVVWDRHKPLTDYLQVDTYVTMVATVVAARDTPMPLSIGLFGEWGAGKSYFMGLLQQRVAWLAADARSKPDSASCSHVVQVRFNAWHYADANLWASLAVQLFEQLVGGEDRADAEQTAARSTLLTSLRTYEEARASLADDQRRAETARNAAEGALANAQRRRRDSETALADVRGSDLARAVAEDPRVRPMVERIRAEVADLDQQLGPDVADLFRLAGELSALAVDASRLWQLARQRTPRVRLVLAVAVVLAVAGVTLLAIPGLVPAVGVVSSIAAALVALVAVARAVVNIAVGVRTALRHVEQTIAVADSAWQRAEQRWQADIAALRDQVERATAEERDIADRVVHARRQVERTKQEIADLGEGRRLYRFIAERAASDDYRKQLGVVSLIRQDFEELTRRLRARREDGTDADLPAVERIVLYIDDLDRCMPERVVQVLEAVHLLLAMDLFVVVVGVDPRWLLRSVRGHFHQVLSGRSAGGGGESYWRSTPQDYLEKIFQIPFVLPRMTPQGFAGLLRSFVRTSRAAGPAVPEVAAAGVPGGAEPTAAQHAVAADEATLVAESGSAAEQVATGKSTERLDLTDDELAFLVRLAPLVRTPRAAKRLANIYRMLRVTRDLGPASQFLGDHDHAGDYQAVAQLLGVLTAFPALFGKLCWTGDADARPLLRRSPQDRWSAFIEDLKPRPDAGGWTSPVVGPLPAAEVEDWRRLAAALHAVHSGVTLDDRLKPYQLWAPRISHFSFTSSFTSGSGEPSP